MMVMSSQKAYRIKSYLTALVCTIAAVLLSTRALAGPIHDAVAAKDVRRVAALIKAEPRLVNSTTDGNVTPLHQAASIDEPRLISLLISKGAAVEARTDEGYTPLHSAAYSKSDRAVAALIAAGAKSDAKTKPGISVLHIAIRENAKSVVRLLVTKTHAAYVDEWIESGCVEADATATEKIQKRAYSLFSALLRDDPGNADINFAYGMICQAKGEYSRGRMAFERALLIDDSNDRARLELARSYLIANQSEAAKREFLKVLSRRPDPNVEKEIRRQIRKIDKGDSKWKLTARVEAGYMHDDNINIGPNSSIIDISPIVNGSEIVTTMTIDEISEPLSAIGTYGSVSAALTRGIGNKGLWSAAGDFALYHNFLGEYDDYETLFLQAAGSLQRTAARSYVQLPVKVAQISTGRAPLLNIYGITPWFLLVTGPVGESQIMTVGVLEVRDYAELDDRDGGYFSISETAKHFFGASRHNVSLGLTVFYNPAESDIYENSGKIWSLSAEVQVPALRLQLHTQLRYRTTDYAGQEMLAPYKRSDVQNELTVGVKVFITKWCEFDAQYQYTVNRSTFGLYEYDRSITSVSTVFSF